MIPPAPVCNRRFFTATAILLPLALAFLGVADTVQARRSPASNSRALADGVYLYGDSSSPNQLNREYVVFQHYQGEVVGALYTPRSEFSCFTGNLQNQTLKIQPVTAEAQTSVNAKLTNLHSIANVSANDQRILSICKQTVVTLASRSTR